MDSIADLYVSKTDEELLLLCSDSEELEPQARAMLKAEMSRRGLTERQADEMQAELAFERQIEEKKAIARKLDFGRAAYFGKTNRVSLSKTHRERFTTTVFRAYWPIPLLIPLGTYRVERFKNAWRQKFIVLEQLPLDRLQLLRMALYGCALIAAVVGAMFLWMFLTN